MTLRPGLDPILARTQCVEIERKLKVNRTRFDGRVACLRPFITVQHNNNKTVLLFCFCQKLAPNRLRKQQQKFEISFEKPKEMTYLRQN